MILSGGRISYSKVMIYDGDKVRADKEVERCEQEGQ